MVKDGNFNLFQALVGFRIANASVRRNANGISSRLQSTKGENATNQVTLTQLVDFINGQFQSIHE